MDFHASTKRTDIPIREGERKKGGQRVNFKGKKIGGGGIPIISSCGTRGAALGERGGTENFDGRMSVLPRGSSPLHASLELEKLLRQGVSTSANKQQFVLNDFEALKRTSYGNLRSGAGCFSAKNSNAAHALLFAGGPKASTPTRSRSNQRNPMKID